MSEDINSEIHKRSYRKQIVIGIIGAALATTILTNTLQNALWSIQQVPVEVNRYEWGGNGYSNDDSYLIVSFNERSIDYGIGEITHFYMGKYVGSWNETNYKYFPPLKEYNFVYFDTSESDWNAEQILKESQEMKSEMAICHSQLVVYKGNEQTQFGDNAALNIYEPKDECVVPIKYGYHGYDYIVYVPRYGDANYTAINERLSVLYAERKAEVQETGNLVVITCPDHDKELCYSTASSYLEEGFTISSQAPSEGFGANWREHNWIVTLERN